MPRQRDGLFADAFHQIAVAADDVGAVVDEMVAEFSRQHALGQRHAHAVRQALAQRASGRFDARRMAVFGMARRVAAELAKALQLVDGHLWIAGQIERRIEQH